MRHKPPARLGLSAKTRLTLPWRGLTVRFVPGFLLPCISSFPSQQQGEGAAENPGSAPLLLFFPNKFSPRRDLQRPCRRRLLQPHRHFNALNTAGRGTGCPRGFWHRGGVFAPPAPSRAVAAPSAARAHPPHPARDPPESLSRGCGGPEAGGNRRAGETGAAGLDPCVTPVGRGQGTGLGLGGGG